jgi:hypothetical protein
MKRFGSAALPIVAMIAVSIMSAASWRPTRSSRPRFSTT